jgi:hypothetical protein
MASASSGSLFDEETTRDVGESFAKPGVEQEKCESESEIVRSKGFDGTFPTHGIPYPLTYHVRENDARIVFSSRFEFRN